MYKINKKIIINYVRKEKINQVYVRSKIIIKIRFNYY